MTVFIQNQDKSSKHFKKWNRTGTVKEVRDFDQYVISVDGTGRLTLRNRQFLKVRQGDCQDTYTNHVGNSDARLRETQVQPPTESGLMDNIPHQIAQPPSDESTHAPTLDSHQSPSLNETPPSSSPQIDSQPITEEPFPDQTHLSQHDGLRRSTRPKKQTEFYNAEDGTYGSANV